jgi:sulfur transfer complex TusBCD TusB component (DsrH family)
MLRIGIILLCFGALYIIKPDVYRRGIWKQTDVAQRKLTPVQYTRYVRLLGVGFIVAGIVLVILSRQ